MHPDTDQIEDRLLTEATARVTWGDDPDDVVRHLVSLEMDEPAAKNMVARLVVERTAEVRRRSITKLGAGILMTVAAVIYFVWYLQAENRRSGVSSAVWWRLWGITFMSLGIAGLASAWRGLNGLILPRAEALTDVEDDE